MVRRAMAYVAAAIMMCAAGTALLQLAVQLLSFPAPIAVPAIALMAAAPLNGLPDRLGGHHLCGAGGRLRSWLGPPAG